MTELLLLAMVIALPITAVVSVLAGAHIAMKCRTGMPLYRKHDPAMWSKILEEPVADEDKYRP
jgi:hypothetical protein